VKALLTIELLISACLRDETSSASRGRSLKKGAVPGRVRVNDDEIQVYLTLSYRSTGLLLPFARGAVIP
jgi:hypothetical protein